jgi:hypothetical protein
MNVLKRRKHAILLIAIIGMALVESFSHRLLLGPITSDLVISTTRLLALLIVFERRLNRLIAFLAMTIALAIDWAQYVLPPSFPQASLRLLYHSALLLFVGFAAIIILRNIFERRVIGADDVLGAVCGYLLAAGAWSHLFLLIEIFVPGSFSIGPGFVATLDTWQGRTAVMNYVSLGSLTGVGSGGVVPVRPPATILITLEAVFGQFYLAVVVAQLVGARLSQALPRNTVPRD